MIFRALFFVAVSLLPMAALAEAPKAPTPAPAAAPAPQAQNSRWALLPNIMLEDVIYPAATPGGATPVANILSSESSTLRSGHTIISTLIRLDNPEPRAKGVRANDYVRCFEYFTPNFSQDGTRCFVLQPRH